MIISNFELWFFSSFFLYGLIIKKKKGIREKLFEFNKLENHQDRFISVGLFKHTNISAINIEIWSFSACVFLTCFIYIWSRERIKICYKCIRIENKKITEKCREKIRLWIDKHLGEHWQRKRKPKTRKAKE